MSKWNKITQEWKEQELTESTKEKPPIEQRSRNTDKNEPKIVETVGNICIICKRQFNSQETLNKHVQQSDLHKQNLVMAKHRAMIQHQNAKEELLGMGDNQPASSTSGLGSIPDLSDSTGARLLKKQGWKEGEGLGKTSSGITAPIEVEIRADRAGLGLESSTMKVGEDYHAVNKKKARNRYEDVFGITENDDDATKRAKLSSY